MRLTVVACVVLLPAVTQAQVVTEMTPERIREAITAADGPPRTRDYMWCEVNCVHSLAVFVSTPFSGVEMAAREAKKKYLPFTEKDVAPQLLMMEMELYVPAFMGGKSITSGVVNVEHVVAAGEGETDRAKVIQPTSIEKEPAEWSSASGATRKGYGVTARFPLSILQPGKEFRIILSSGREASFKLTPDFLAKIR
jgi:hypothetical protein